MPDQASTRYEEHDWPGFQSAMQELCGDCTLIYQNANADIALQQQQFNSAIAQGATIIVLDPVDSAAAAALVDFKTLPFSERSSSSRLDRRARGR